MKTAAKKFLTLIACQGRKVHGISAPVHPYCRSCGDLVYEHTGDRCNISPVPCPCEKKPTDESGESVGKRSSKDHHDAQTAKKQATTARKMNGLDAAGHNMKERYCRRLALVSTRYPGKDPKQVISCLLGCDIQLDDDASGDGPGGVTGKAGGIMLACYLHSIKDTKEKMFKNGIKEWLKRQKINYEVNFPVQEACIVEALAFLPELDRELAKAAASELPPAPVFESDSDDSEEEE